MKKKNQKRRGSIMFQVLIFGAIAMLFLGGLIAWSGSNVRYARNFYHRELTLDVAESGIEYYRWHLAHAAVDYKDGTNNPGPYTHPYYDAQGKKIGQFVLDITAPPIGSTVVKIRSTGTLDAAPGVKRVIEVVMGKPSLAKYAVAANANIRFGAGTQVFGKLHSNGGIHFDGIAYNIVSSAKATYTDPDHAGGYEYAVHTHTAPADPLPPTPLPTRINVFKIGRQMPVAPVDFTGFTADLANIKAQAQLSGIYLASSGNLGYRLVLKVNDTVDVYKVTSLQAPPSGCTNVGGQSGWGSWSIKNQSFQNNQPIPANGAIFVEDNVWVDGQINTTRLTIASGRFPEVPATNTSITINNNLTYTNYNGDDVISLMSQNNVNVGMASLDTLRIDAALIAKNGRVGRFYYGSPSCAPYAVRNTITLYGMIATNLRYGFAYTDNTGYLNRNITYDGNLYYGPPPYFPLTTDQYERISWKETQ